MIIKSPNYVLTALTTPNANAPVIGYDNRVTETNISATNSDPLFPVTRLANPSTAELWKALDDTSPNYITVLPDTADDLDYFGICKHNFGSIAATLSLEINTGSGYVTEIPNFIPANDLPLLLRFEPQGLAGIRLKIQPQEYTTPQAAVAYVGKLLALQRNLYVGHTPISYGRNFKVSTGVSEDGNYLGRVVLRQGNTSQIEIKNMDPAWYRTYLDPFFVAQAETPFFFGWRPGKYPKEIGYCWIPSSPRPSNQQPNGMMGVSFPIEGIA